MSGHLSLVYRGNEQTAKKFIEIQDEVLEEIKTLLDEMSKTEGEEYKEIGESGTTVVSGYTRINKNSIIAEGNRIATSELPATASLGTDDVGAVANIMGGE